MRTAIYSASDIREVPAYPVSEAAHYLLIPASTIRWWVTGRSYHGSIRQESKPIIELPHGNGNGTLLSFKNLIEIHVLDAIRRKHRISLDDVRSAIQYLKKHHPSKHPLLDQQFVTYGMQIFIEHYVELVCISRDGQLAMKELLQAHLQRIDRDADGLPIRLYPFTRKREVQEQEPKTVVIDPSISFGRPILVGTGIATSVIAQRYKAGESIEELADDYRRAIPEIQEAIRCELYRPEAA